MLTCFSYCFTICGWWDALYQQSLLEGVFSIRRKNTERVIRERFEVGLGLFFLNHHCLENLIFVYRTVLPGETGKSPSLEMLRTWVGKTLSDVTTPAC